MNERITLTKGQLEALTTTVEEIEQTLQAYADLESCKLKFDLYAPGNVVSVTALYDKGDWTYEMEVKA